MAESGFTETLLQEHLDTVYRYALRLAGSPDAAADLTQETMLRAWREPALAPGGRGREGVAAADRGQHPLRRPPPPRAALSPGGAARQRPAARAQDNRGERKPEPRPRGAGRPCPTDNAA